MYARLSQISRPATLILLLTLPACAGGGGLGTLGDILGSAAGVPGQTPQQGQLRAEVQQVDQQRQQIQVSTADGQSGAVRYDQSTQVLYQQQSYPVTALERGDLVVMEVQQLQGGDLYTNRITVEQSVQERTGQGTTASGQVEQIEGEVGQIDHQRGSFTLQTRSGQWLTVALPYNPPPTAEERFHRLRSGEFVRLEGIHVGDGRVELYQFR
ncbi:MAG: hypothetical protein WD766_06110 [Gemmatimonadota bacterium]